MKKNRLGNPRTVLVSLLFIQLLVLLLAIESDASSTRPVILNADQDRYRLGLNLSYFEDRNGDYTFQKIKNSLLSHQFVPSDKQTPSFGYTNSVYWAYFVIRNPLKTEKELLLEMAHPFMKSILIYHATDGKAFAKTTGGVQLRRTAQEVRSRNHVFSFTFAPMSETEFIMRFENGGPMSFPLSFWTLKAFINKVDLERIILGGFYGIFIALLIYNFTIFIFLRDKSYLYYVIFLASIILYQLSADGIGYQYVWKTSQWFSVNSIILWHVIILAYLNFSRSFLDVKTHTPRLDKILGFITYLVLFDIALSQFWDMMLSLKIALYCQVIATLLLIWISAICIRNQSRPAKFYFMAMVFLLTGTLATLLKNAGLLPQNVMTIWGAHWGSTAEVLLLSIGLSDRIHTMRNERFLAQKAAMTNKQLFIDTLEKAEKRVNQIFNNAVEGIFQISGDNRLVFANPAMAEIFGYESVEEMLATAANIKTLFENDADYQVSHKQLIEKQRYVNYEVPLLKKDGERFYATISIQALAETQSLVGTIEHDVFAEGMVLDITDRRLREKAERRLEVAEHANQAKSDFLANVTHELRTPLQAILGYAGLGIDRFKEISEEKVLTYFGEITTGGNKLLRLIDDLLDLSKLEADAIDYNFARERLSVITSFVIKELDSIRATRDISIQFKPSGFDDLLDMDTEKMIQVIRNLVANAIRFTNQHDVINVSIEKLSSEYQFSIRDRGIGIPEDEINLIFDPFIQSSRNRKKDGGTGLGLSISKKIIENHGGTIWAENHPAGGAVFSFRLPESQNLKEHLDVQ